MDERAQVLRFWWLLELFSPQKLPKLANAGDHRAIAWSPGKPLPWETLAPPKPLGRKRRKWRHKVYLGVYDVELIYKSLVKDFGEDKNAYDERPAGQSACAGIVIDECGLPSVGSAVLSSAAWAVGRVRRRESLEEFEAALNAFRETVYEYEAGCRDGSESEDPTPLDEPSLLELAALSEAAAGVSDVEELNTGRVVIESVAVLIKSEDEANESDFLNSFYLDDLQLVRDQLLKRNVGPALAAYLAHDGDSNVSQRLDVVKTPEVVDEGVCAMRLPSGRWPSRPDHPLALSQQFAVNGALNDLSSRSGLMGVNGPPGTGKTTMLRDILAGNVVERARHLAALTDPKKAFTGTVHSWTADGDHERRVPQLRKELTGFEMLVASANNGAVENISTEIPGRKAIDEPWRDSTGYFRDLATAILREAEKKQNGRQNEPTEAWGLVAARLGNKSNRAAFRTSFWFDEKSESSEGSTDGGVPRMQTLLNRWNSGDAPYVSWNDARKRWAEAEQRVNSLIGARQDAEQRRAGIAQMSRELSEIANAAKEAQEASARVARGVAAHVYREVETAEALARASASYDRQVAVKPGLLETLSTLGRALRSWRAEVTLLAGKRETAETIHAEAEAQGRRLRAVASDSERDVASAERDLERIRRDLAALTDQCDADAIRYGDAYPGRTVSGDDRQRRAPWLDEELDTARSELFLASLQLHQDFVANCAGKLTGGLRAARDIVSGDVPHDLAPEKVLAGWQLFFLVVPLVSTTFASVDRMLRGMGRESIGWLFIDEAGQAAPQQAAGAIWRAKRVIAVGDPLQLQPVVTIPHKAQRSLAARCGVANTWIPPQASVQTLADRVATHGTYLAQPEGKSVWVSAPLRVHRRCDDPMFTLCNRIAYNGIMVNGVKRTLEDPAKPDIFDDPSEAPRILASRWIHESADRTGSHLQPNQIERLKRALNYLSEQGVPSSDVIAISPFREVASELEALSRDYPGLRAGTIHTAQGREAKVVFLVLGGDPAKPGAKDWAAKTVNLVNVAASRAQRRIYVIGDRDTWASKNFFRQLSAALQPVLVDDESL